MKKSIFISIVSIVVMAFLAVQYVVAEREHHEQEQKIEKDSHCLLWVDKDGSYFMSPEILSPEHLEDLPNSSEIVISVGKGMLSIPIEGLFSFDGSTVRKKIMRENYDDEAGHHITLYSLRECLEDVYGGSIYRTYATVVDVRDISCLSDFEEFEGGMEPKLFL